MRSQPPPSSVWSPLSSVPHRSSAGELPTLRLRPTNVLLWFPDPASHMQVCTPLPPTYTAGGTWLGCGCVWRGEGDGAPRGGLESVVSPAGITRQAAKVHAYARRSTSLSIPAVRNSLESLDSSGRLRPGKRAVVDARNLSRFLRGVCLSVCPPPPPSHFPRTTERVPLLSLLTGESFRGRSTLPCSTGTSRPGGCFPRLWTPSLSSPPSLPIPWPSLLGRVVPYRESSSVLGGT